MTSGITAEEYQSRIGASCRIYSVASNLGNIRAARNTRLMLSFRDISPGDSVFSKPSWKPGSC